MNKERDPTQYELWLKVYDSFCPFHLGIPPHSMSEYTDEQLRQLARTFNTFLHDLCGYIARQSAGSGAVGIAGTIGVCTRAELERLIYSELQHAHKLLGNIYDMQEEGKITKPVLPEQIPYFNTKPIADDLDVQDASSPDNGEIEKTAEDSDDSSDTAEEPDDKAAAVDVVETEFADEDANDGLMCNEIYRFAIYAIVIASILAIITNQHY
jgi:hypothetical protein